MLHRGSLISLFVRHPNAANLLMALLILFGFFGLLKLNTQFFPTIESNVISISVAWPGASAEDVENNILDIIEPEVRFLNDLDDLTSYAREGSASISLEFLPSANMQKALSDTEQAVSSLSTLPVDSERPLIALSQRYDSVAKMSVSGPFPERALQYYAWQVRDALIDNGIDRVNFEGLRQREIVVDVNPLALRRLNLSLNDVVNALSQNSLDIPSGSLDGVQERQIRVLAKGETIHSLGRIEVKALPNGDRIEVRDIATLRNLFDESDIIAFANGEPAIELDIVRALTSDTLEAKNRVIRTYEALKGRFPETLSFKLYDIRADRVSERINLLVINGLTGLALVIGILFLFLNIRIALWVAAGIPVAVLAALGFMWLSGQSINMISLFALIMTLGIIVDDAIVVGEHTASRFSAGDDSYMAAQRGAGTMLTPVIAAMATTAAAFSPILLIGDTIGQIMGALPLVVLAVLAASLIECFLILPGHLAHSLDHKPSRNFSWLKVGSFASLLAVFCMVLALRPALLKDYGLGWMGTLLSSFYQLSPLLFIISIISFWFGLMMWLEKRRFSQKERHLKHYKMRQMLDKGFEAFRDGFVRNLATLSYQWRYVTFSIAVGLLIVTIGFLQGGRVGFVFFPSPESETIRANVFFSPGINQNKAIQALETIEKSLFKTTKELTKDRHETLVQSSFITLGKAGFNRGDNVARLTIELTSSETRTIRTPIIVREWRKNMPHISGVQRIAISERRAGPPGRDLDIRLSGASSPLLKQAALDIQDMLTSIPGLSGIEDDLVYGKPETILRLKPQASSLGLSAQDIGRQVRTALQGTIARRLPGVDDDIPLRVRQSQTDSSQQLSGLENVDIRTNQGAYLSLTDLVSLEQKQGFSVIKRDNGRTIVSVTGDVDFDLITSDTLLERLNDGQLEAITQRYGIDYRLSGRAEEQQKSFADLRLGVFVALGTIYIILAWVFASYARPLAVMMIIPFGFIGAVIGHMVLGFPLTILSLIGLLGLSGILVNDSIILVARFAELLKEGMAYHDAAVQASCDRTRAVMLTSLTTVGGLTPLLFEKSLQAQFLMPMAITIVFGISVATLFILFLIPALLGIGKDIRWLFSKEEMPSQDLLR